MAEPVDTAELESDVERDIPFGSPAEVQAVRDATRNEQARRRPPRPWRRKRFAGVQHLLPRWSGKLVWGLVIVGFIVLFGLIGPLIVAESARLRQSRAPAAEPRALARHHQARLRRVRPAGLRHPRLALRSASWRASIALVLAILFGILAGYFGGVLDEVLSLFTNIMLVIPGLAAGDRDRHLRAEHAWSRTPRAQLAHGGDRARHHQLGGLGASCCAAQAQSLRTRDYVPPRGSRARSRCADPLRRDPAEPGAAARRAVHLRHHLRDPRRGRPVVPRPRRHRLDHLGHDAQRRADRAGRRQRRVVVVRSAGARSIALLGAGLSLINFAIDEIIDPKLRLAPQAARRAAPGGPEPRRQQSADGGAFA